MQPFDLETAAFSSDVSAEQCAVALQRLRRHGHCTLRGQTTRNYAFGRVLAEITFTAHPGGETLYAEGTRLEGDDHVPVPRTRIADSYESDVQIASAMVMFVAYGASLP